MVQIILYKTLVELEQMVRGLDVAAKEKNIKTHYIQFCDKYFGGNLFDLNKIQEFVIHKNETLSWVEIRNTEYDIPLIFEFGNPDEAILFKLIWG
jgi:hypothetical protein